MAMQSENIHAEDAGLLALWLFLHLHGVDVAIDRIRERCGNATVGIRAMLRCASQFGVEARSRTADWKRLTGMRLPGIASLRDGGFLLVGRADDNGALVLHPSAPQPKLMTRAELEAIWDGRMVSARSAGFMERVRDAFFDAYSEASIRWCGLAARMGQARRVSNQSNIGTASAQPGSASADEAG